MRDMLLTCSFGGIACTPQNFSRWSHPTYGNCYTMFVASTVYPSFVGPEYGLRLTLYAQEFEYLPIIIPATGFRVNNQTHYKTSTTDATSTYACVTNIRRTVS